MFPITCSQYFAGKLHNNLLANYFILIFYKSTVENKILKKIWQNLYENICHGKQYSG